MLYSDWLKIANRQSLVLDYGFTFTSCENEIPGCILRRRRLGAADYRVADRSRSRGGERGEEGVNHPIDRSSELSKGEIDPRNSHEGEHTSLGYYASMRKYACEPFYDAVRCRERSIAGSRPRVLSRSLARADRVEFSHESADKRAAASVTI